jgi:beta-galactosidase
MIINYSRLLSGAICLAVLGCASTVQSQSRRVISFDHDWSFFMGADTLTNGNAYPKMWRAVRLPHDWSIEADFSSVHPATNQGGALPGGIGWYRKIFRIPKDAQDQLVSVEFDGVHKNAEVWINGHRLGLRPSGYMGFSHELTAHLNKKSNNLLVVRVDNSLQPNERWYTGSGIYRHMRLVMRHKQSVKHWGSQVTTSVANADRAEVVLNHEVEWTSGVGQHRVDILDPSGRIVATTGLRSWKKAVAGDTMLTDRLQVLRPQRWSTTSPKLYRAVMRLYRAGVETDKYETSFGIRSTGFDAAGRFTLNGAPTLLKGVCMHHDLGVLGAAVNTRAMERQLEILKDMGCNAIRTAHNPPAPEFLELCDRMGFLVIDESFDQWRKKKNKYDYHLDFEAWHARDLADMIRRDRNHPSVVIWSIGNEIREQFDSSGLRITKTLAGIVRSLDATRPVISALTETQPSKNFISMSGALDVLGFNYKSYDYDSLPIRFPGMPLIATETASALQTRGVYPPRADSLRIWPPDYKVQANFTGGFPDHTCSAYDNTFAYWGITHERAWVDVKRQPKLAGAFVWSGFDYLGEPTPYPFPARSSYFGIIDLAGFPKDVYHMYRSEWTDKPVLHVFPHWNHQVGDTVDVWAYYGQADEVELYLNGKSLGRRSKSDSVLHVSWKVPYVPGVITAVSRTGSREVLRREVRTAGKPVGIRLSADRSSLKSGDRDLSFVKAELIDAHGVVVPDGDRMIRFSVIGSGRIVGTDNGYQADTVRLVSPDRKTWKGLALAVVEAGDKQGNITIVAETLGLPKSLLRLSVR